jgi:hypothetical protein
VIIFGGSYPDDITIAGPEVTDQMPAWITDQNGNPIPESNLVQYPGSKFQQAENAKGLTLNSPARLICYSSGTESCLIYAQWRISQGLGVEDVVLLGPTFSGANTEDGPVIEFGTSGGELDDWASYMDYLLVNGTDVLVVDDGVRVSQGAEASAYRSSENATGAFNYLRIHQAHYELGGYFQSATNNKVSFKMQVYLWMNHN